MKSKVIVSSYPLTVLIGNYRWHPGVNELPESEWPKVHWPTVAHDPRLNEAEVATVGAASPAAALETAPVR